jgi:GNAT superfamily N-acetyltransferase
VRGGLELRELGAGEFLANLDACTRVYAAAMDPPEYQLPGRHSIMERHAGYAAFRAIAVIQAAGTGPAATGPAATGPAEARPAGDRPARDRAARDRAAGDGATWTGPAGNGPLIGFAYGFHGEGGKWWHDLVSRAVTSACGREAAADWLTDSFEIAEVHVLPGHQGQGTGHAMMLRLTAGRPERTAVLSTMDADTRARRLYRRLGFTDLIAGYAFAGTDDPYAIMGAPLPLREGTPSSARPESPSRW